MSKPTTRYVITPSEWADAWYPLKISWRIRTRMQLSFAFFPDQLRQ